jgi:hypothetical protein
MRELQYAAAISRYVRGGIYRHFKGRYYRTYELCVSMSVVGVDALELEGFNHVALYSEDPSQHLLVVRMNPAGYGPFGASSAVCGVDSRLDAEGPLVLYRPMPTEDDLHPPRFIRPLVGPAGFLTPTDSGEVRFEYVPGTG